MAAIKISVIAAHFLGLSSFLYGVLLAILPHSWLTDIHLQDIREPFKTVIIIIGILYMLIQCLRVWETVIERRERNKGLRIENNRKAFELKKEMEGYLSAK